MNDAIVEVSIIIVNFNTKQMTKECIDSIFKFTKGISYEVIVVDNNSTDGIKEFLELDDRIIYVYNSSNLGFGRANNVGAGYAKGEVLFFLNTDTLIIDNVIYDMFCFLKQNLKVAICGTNLVNKELAPTLSFERFFPSIKYLLNELLCRVPGRVLYGRNLRYNYTNRPIQVAYVSGADLMIKSELFKKVGGFDSNFFMYWEETDLCLQIHRLGYDIIALPDHKIIHFGGSSFQNHSRLPSAKKLNIQYASMRYFLEKNYSIKEIRLYYFIYSINIHLRCFFYKIIHNKDKYEMWRNDLIIHRQNKQL